MKNTLSVSLYLFLALTLLACSGKSTTDTRALETQVAARIFATQTASVPTPTDTPRATATLEPTFTPTSTSTPEPTFTASPTATSRPTATPTAAAPIPPRGTYRHSYKITEEFDRFTSQTDVTLNAQPSEYRRAPGSLFVLYSYAGTEPTEPAAITLGFASQADEWQYLRCYSLALLLDGRISIRPKTTYDGRVGSGYVLEFVMVDSLSVSEFLQIVNAEKVEGELCNTEFVLSSEQMEALRDVASRMQP